MERPITANRCIAPPAIWDPITAYDHLAPEYDDPAHETTRHLERVSSVALDRAGTLERVSVERPLILELGCGTGALTQSLVRLHPRATIVATDPSSAMLGQAARRLHAGQRASLEFVRADARAAIRQYAHDADVIACGLSDPYFSHDLVHELALHQATGAVTFITVPTRRWARHERVRRLGLSPELTRFRTLTGEPVVTRSLALDVSALERLIGDARLTVVAAGEVRSVVGGLNPPEISWALATPHLSRL